MFDALVVNELAGVVDRLGGLPSAADDAERVDRIAVLERLKAAVYGAQLVEVAEFAASQEAANKAMGIPARQAGRGVPEQVGLAGVAGVGGPAGSPDQRADGSVAGHVRAVAPG